MGEIESRKHQVDDADDRVKPVKKTERVRTKSWTFRDQVTISVAQALSPLLSVAVTVYVPAVEGAVIVVVKPPEEVVVTVCVAEPTFNVTVDEGAKLVPVTVVPAEQLLGERDIVGGVRAVMDDDASLSQRPPWRSARETGCIVQK